MRQTRKIQRLNEKIIESLGNVVEFRDVESGAHIKRVKFLQKSWRNVQKRNARNMD